MRTIEDFEQYIIPVKDILHEKFIPTLMGIDTPLDKSLQKIVSQPPKHGGLGLPELVQEANSQHQSSKLVTKIHVESIIEQRVIMKELDSYGNSQSDLDGINRSIKQNIKETVLKKSDTGSS